MRPKHRENANEIFKSEKTDKLDELVKAVNNLTINDAEYYESNTATASDAQGDISRNPGKVTHTSNRTVEQKLMSYLTIPVMPPPMNPGIYQGIAPIILAPQKILTPAMKKVDTDMLGQDCKVHRNMRQVRWTGVDVSTLGDICNSVSVVEPSSTFLIGIVGTSPFCGLNVSQEVGKKRQSTFPGLVVKSQNWTLSLTESCPIISI